MKKKFALTLTILGLTAALTACSNSPSTVEPGYVGLDAAKETALTASQLTAADATFTTAELEDHDGTAYYELDFNDGTTAYHYAVDAVTGAVIESSSEAVGLATDTSTSNDIGEEKAKDIALKDAGIAEADTVYLLVKPDYDDGTAIYEVEFYAGSTEYDYEIDAGTGEIRSMDHDAEGYTASAAGSSSAAISETEAKTTALNDAGIKESDTAYLSVKLDYDDGVQVYDVEFYVASTATEYDYEIEASTGKIRSKDSDAEGYTKPVSGATGTSTSASVDEARAREIALADAGVSASDVTFRTVKQDYDDGIQKYEIEFCVTGTGVVYDYEINAQTGKILSSEQDTNGYRGGQQGSGNGSGTMKSESECQAIALGKVPGATGEHIRMRLERDNGVQKYEGSIVYDGMEYEFEIDAYSGAILEWDAESIYD